MNELLQSPKDISQSCIFDFPDRPERPVPPIDPNNPPNPPLEYPYEPILDWPPPPGQDPIPGSNPHPIPISNPATVQGRALLFKLIPSNPDFGYGNTTFIEAMHSFARYAYFTYAFSPESYAIIGRSSPSESDETGTIFIQWNFLNLHDDISGILSVYNPHEVLINFNLQFSVYNFHGTIDEVRPDSTQPFGFWRVNAIDSIRHYFHSFTFPAGPHGGVASINFANFYYHHLTGVTDFTWLV